MYFRIAAKNSLIAYRNKEKAKFTGLNESLSLIRTKFKNDQDMEDFIKKKSKRL